MRLALILAAVIFVITLLVRLPASLLLSHLPPDISCDEPSGTVWHGTCDQVRSNGIDIPQVSWTVHPLSLLSLTLSVDLNSVDPNTGGSASVELHRNGDASITALHATVPLTAASNVLPAGSSAILTLALPSVKTRGEHLIAVEGTLDLKQLHVANPPADLGSFEMQFDPADDSGVMNGQLHDLDGPLSVRGLLRLQPTGAYLITGTVSPRASASNDLNQALQMFLASPDAQGQRPFSLEGTL